MYTKGVFFFDIHPPLGKLLLALAGYVGGFDGQYNFERIGSGGLAISSSCVAPLHS